MNYNLFTRSENEILQTATHKCISSIHTYKLNYKEGLNICAFIQVIFEESTPIIISTGSFADNIVLLNTLEFKKELDKYDTQSDVKMKVDGPNKEHFAIGEKLLNIECVQKPGEDYYWQINFYFRSGILHFAALVDELEVSSTDY